MRKPALSMLTTAATLLATVLMACSLGIGQPQVANELDPAVYNEDEPMLLTTLWESSQPQRGSVAGDQYKNRWMLIEVDFVNTGDGSGTLTKRMPSPPNIIELKYNYSEHADAARDEEDFLVVCNIGGVPITGDKLVLNYCRPPT